MLCAYLQLPILGKSQTACSACGIVFAPALLGAGRWLRAPCSGAQPLLVWRKHGRLAMMATIGMFFPQHELLPLTGAERSGAQVALCY